MTKDEILSRLASLPGDIGFYYKSLSTGESFGYREIILGGMAVNLVAVFAVMYARRSHVKKIYNCEV